MLIIFPSSHTYIENFVMWKTIWIWPLGPIKSGKCCFGCFGDQCIKCTCLWVQVEGLKFIPTYYVHVILLLLVLLLVFEVVLISCVFFWAGVWHVVTSVKCFEEVHIWGFVLIMNLGFRGHVCSSSYFMEHCFKHVDFGTGQVPWAETRGFSKINLKSWNPNLRFSWKARTGQHRFTEAT